MEDEQDCGYDYVQVFSGYDDEGPTYGTFCGNSIPPEIISVDEALLLRFVSDDTINSKGFGASYVVISDANEFDYGSDLAEEDSHESRDEEEDLEDFLEENDEIILAQRQTVKELI